MSSFTVFAETCVMTSNGQHVWKAWNVLHDNPRKTTVIEQVLTHDTKNSIWNSSGLLQQPPESKPEDISSFLPENHRFFKSHLKCSFLSAAKLEMSTQCYYACKLRQQGWHFALISFPKTSHFKSPPWARLTTVGVAPLLQVGVALQSAVSRGDVLWGAGNGGFSHDWVGVWRLVHGFKLQPLVVNPKIGWLQVFGVPLVFVRAVGRFWGSPLSIGENTELLATAAKQSKILEGADL